MNNQKNSSGRSILRYAIIAVAVVIVLAGAYLAFVLISGGDGQASQNITAPTLAPVSTTAAPTVDEPTEEATEAVIATEEAEALAATEETSATVEALTVTEEATVEAADVQATTQPTAEATAEATEAAGASAGGATAGIVTYSIVPEESEVSFSLDEDLRGQRVTVVGTTNQVAGQVRVNFADPSQSQVGVIRINLRTLRTDSENRDRAMRSQVLLTAQDEFEFTDFVPTALSGLPETATVGEPITFQITGDLTLRGITRSVTFDATVTPISETRLEGVATTIIQRADFELNIPDVPFIANVDEAVELTIRFVAAADEAGA